MGLTPRTDPFVCRSTTQALFDGLDDRKNLRLLPNMAFSRALATFYVEAAAAAAAAGEDDGEGGADVAVDHTASTRLLVDAMVQFPAAVAALADACKVVLPARALRHPAVTAYGRRPGEGEGRMPDADADEDRVRAGCRRRPASTALGWARR